MSSSAFEVHNRDYHDHSVTGRCGKLNAIERLTNTAQKRPLNRTNDGITLYQSLSIWRSSCSEDSTQIIVHKNLALQNIKNPGVKPGLFYQTPIMFHLMCNMPYNTPCILQFDYAAMVPYIVPQDQVSQDI